MIETTIIHHRINTVGRTVILKTSIHPMTNPVHVVATGIAIVDPIAIKAVGNQIAIGEVERRSEAESAAIAPRPKIVSSIGPKATSETVVATIATVAVVAAAVAAKARSTNATDLIDNLVKKPKGIIVRGVKTQRGGPPILKPSQLGVTPQGRGGAAMKERKTKRN